MCWASFQLQGIWQWLEQCPCCHRASTLLGESDSSQTNKQIHDKMSPCLQHDTSHAQQCREEKCSTVGGGRAGTLPDGSDQWFQLCSAHTFHQCPQKSPCPGLGPPLSAAPRKNNAYSKCLGTGPAKLLLNQQPQVGPQLLLALGTCVRERASELGEEPSPLNLQICWHRLPRKTLPALLGLWEALSRLQSAPGVPHTGSTPPPTFSPSPRQ